MSKQITKILVVEDNPQHLKEAVEQLEAKGLEVVTATSSEDGIRLLEKYGRGLSGVITDVYMPDGIRGKESGEYPNGLLVAAAAQKSKLPLVVCTAGFHHGRRYHFASSLCNMMQWKLVEHQPKAGNNEEEAQHKDWGRALEQLILQAQQ